MHRTRVRDILVLPAETCVEKNASKHFIRYQEGFVPQDSKARLIIHNWSQDEPGKKSLRTVVEPRAETTRRQAETQEWARPAAHNVSQEYSTQEGADKTGHFSIN